MRSLDLLFAAALVGLAMPTGASATPTFDAIEIRLVAEGATTGPRLTLEGSDQVVAVETTPLLCSQDFESAGDVIWMEGEPGFEVALTDAGSAKLARLSTENVGKSLAFIVDGKLLMTPKILDPIVAEGFLLTTNGGEQEARKLATTVSRAINNAK